MLRRLFSRLQNLDFRSWWLWLLCIGGAHQKTFMYEMTPNGQQPSEGKFFVCGRLGCHWTHGHYYLWKHRQNVKLAKQCHEATRAIKFWMMRKNAGWKV
jgi:hypothetical protein